MDNSWKMRLTIALIVLLPLLLAGCVTPLLVNENSLKLKEEDGQMAEIPVNVSPDSPSTEQYLVSIFAFHDYDGNGKRDRRERSIEGIRISTADLTYVTSRDGKADLGYVQSGRYALAIQDPSNKFRYIFPSVSEVRPVGDELEIAVDRDMEVLLPLAEGFLTSPYRVRVRHKPLYVDIDPQESILDWEGRRQTYRGHRGTDYIFNEGNDVLASAPGEVSDIFLNEERGGHTIWIYHGPIGSRIWWTYYAHLRSVRVELGQTISRGAVIGDSGSGMDVFTGKSVPHLHFEVLYKKNPSDQTRSIDPYRDLSYGDHEHWPLANPFSLWTVDNKPS